MTEKCCSENETESETDVGKRSRNQRPIQCVLHFGVCAKLSLPQYVYLCIIDTCSVIMPIY